jgi:membrane protein DedA with SNARE-associated domain
MRKRLPQAKYIVLMGLSVLIEVLIVWWLLTQNGTDGHASRGQQLVAGLSIWVVIIADVVVLRYWNQRRRSKGLP